MSAFSTDRNTWPYTTPSGHTYHAPRTYAELRRMHENAALSSLEGNDEPEHPPEPRWEMVGLAHRHVALLESRLSRLQSRYDKLTAIINRPDQPRHRRDLGLVAAGVIIGMWVTWPRRA